MVAGFRRQARPGVPDRDQDLLPVAVRPGGQGQGSALAHGVEGVEDEVDHALLELVEVAADRRQAFIDEHFQFDALQFYFVTAEHGAALQQFGRVDRVESRRGFAGKGQQAGDDPGAAAGFAFHQF